MFIPFTLFETIDVQVLGILRFKINKVLLCPFEYYDIERIVIDSEGKIIARGIGQFHVQVYKLPTEVYVCVPINPPTDPSRHSSETSPVAF